MFSTRYYNDLIYLSKILNEANGLPEQNEIADSGADLEDPNVEDISGQAEPAPVGEDEINNSELEDANYLNTDAGEVEPPASQRDEKYKLLRLYNLFKNLLGYCSTFINNLDTFNTELLDEDKYLEYIDHKNSFGNLNSKIQDYMLNMFASESYERSLYIYILLRTELLSLTQAIRTIFDLKNPEIEKSTKK